MVAWVSKKILIGMSCEIDVGLSTPALDRLNRCRTGIETVVAAIRIDSTPKILGNISPLASLQIAPTIRIVRRLTKA